MGLAEHKKSFSELPLVATAGSQNFIIIFFQFALQLLLQIVSCQVTFRFDQAHYNNSTFCNALITVIVNTEFI